MHEAIVQWKIVVVLSIKKEFMATARRTRLTLHRRRRAARATAALFHFFIPRGAHHPIPNRRVSVQNYTKRLRRAGYVVKTYHPASLGASDPTKGGSLCYRNVRYFLPPDNNADYLSKTLRNQTRVSWFKPPHYAIVLIRDIFVVSRH
jgi:hypothetical protein